MTSSEEHPLERLARLATSRKASTERLHTAIGHLLLKLEPHVEVGAFVVVDGHQLQRSRTMAHAGANPCEVLGWFFARPNGQDGFTHSELDRPVGETGYFMGDLNAPWNGPSRADLLAFARLAEKFVQAFVKREELNVTLLTEAGGLVDNAIAKLHSEAAS
jgi:hypothetical protein